MNINKNISGTIWSTFERFSKMGIQILCTFIIAQFLPPSEFGLVSMMTIFLAFSTFLVDSGFCQALIHEKEVTEMDKSSLFWFNLLLGIIVYSIFFIIAPYIATFYNEPKLCFLIRIAFLAASYIFQIHKFQNNFKDFNLISNTIRYYWNYHKRIKKGCLGPGSSKPNIFNISMYIFLDI